MDRFQKTSQCSLIDCLLVTGGRRVFIGCWPVLSQCLQALVASGIKFCVTIVSEVPQTYLLSRNSATFSSKGPGPGKPFCFSCICGCQRSPYSSLVCQPVPLQKGDPGLNFSSKDRRNHPGSSYLPFKHDVIMTKHLTVLA